jgi:predicted nucleic-acid-binding Zn-ribbon protein
MGFEAYTVRTYYLSFTCDACGHTEEHSHDIIDRERAEAVGI